MITAGSERYYSLAPMYYRGAVAAVVTYDISVDVIYSIYLYLSIYSYYLFSELTIYIYLFILGRTRLRKLPNGLKNYKEEWIPNQSSR